MNARCYLTASYDISHASVSKTLSFIKELKKDIFFPLLWFPDLQKHSHRMGKIGRDHWSLSSPTSLFLKYATQACIQTALKISREGGSTVSLGNLF